MSMGLTSGGLRLFQIDCGNDCITVNAKKKLLSYAPKWVNCKVCELYLNNVFFFKESLTLQRWLRSNPAKSRIRIEY